ncbi:50S ribosomal protein L29 [candidate division bacterium WOR-3 4484_18]|uniref:Large ribosomal subunit protein uL29 n=1 Tax=candidate division WOR-3 bacterium 4484_18 TaxID=2020626 RepID=A0A257LXR1_UNCW3|nr:MAG: 50S ribosomal protein L29 [candidate division bacterium WOR-3 4484_18]
MRAAELRQMTTEELLNHLNNLKEELFMLRMRKRFEQLSNPLRIRVLRREIARALTVLRERGIKL